MFVEKFLVSQRPSPSVATTFSLVSWQPDAYSRREDELARYGQSPTSD